MGSRQHAVKPLQTVVPVVAAGRASTEGSLCESLHGFRVCKDYSMTPYITRENAKCMECETFPINFKIIVYAKHRKRPITAVGFFNRFLMNSVFIR